MGRKIVVVIAIALAALVLAFGIAGAYHAGYDHGIINNGHVITRVGPGAYWYPGYGRGFGFFPGFLLFPVIVLAVVALVAWRRPWHHHSSLQRETTRPRRSTSAVVMPRDRPGERASHPLFAKGP